METFEIIYVTVVAACLYLFIRNIAVFRFRMKLVDQCYVGQLLTTIRIMLTGGFTTKWQPTKECYSALSH